MFKFRDSGTQLRNVSYKELTDELNDIHHNPEEGCRVLQIVSSSWTQVPPVMGLKLHKVGLSVSHGMKHHKLKLRFGPPQFGGRETSDGQQVVMDSVVKMRLFSWWDPLYPKDGGIHPNLIK